MRELASSRGASRGGATRPLHTLSKMAAAAAALEAVMDIETCEGPKKL